MIDKTRRILPYWELVMMTKKVMLALSLCGLVATEQSHFTNFRVLCAVDCCALQLYISVHILHARDNVMETLSLSVLPSDILCAGVVISTGIMANIAISTSVLTLNVVVVSLLDDLEWYGNVSVYLSSNGNSKP